MEERLRAKRATDAARAMGLEMDFGAGGAAEGESTEGSEVELNAEEVRKKLREVKKRLRQRDNGASRHASAILLSPLDIATT
jgi:hypothetical protein